jgi:accessory gene regulator B
MIERFQDWILEQDIHDVAYYLTTILYIAIMVATLALNGWLLHNWYMVIIGSIVMNAIRQYSGGFHCTSLVKCIVFTNILFIIFGFIANYATAFYFEAMLFSVLCILWIIHRTPVTDSDYPWQSVKWHKLQVIEWCLIFFFLSFFSKVVGLGLIASNITWSIIMVAMLCFKNPSKV